MCVSMGEAQRDEETLTDAVNRADGFVLDVDVNVECTTAYERQRQCVCVKWGMKGLVTCAI